MSARTIATEIFHAAVQVVQPSVLIPRFIRREKKDLMIGNQILPDNSFRKIWITGAGKASAAMAVETEKILGTLITDGLVITKYHHALPTQKITIMEAAHPVPDENSLLSVKKTIDLVKQASQDDIIICLISGGASSLWADTPEGIQLEELRFTFETLLKCGASIHEMNAVRKHLSSFKGGQMVKYCNGARLFTLVISDVPGDDPDTIASGPTVPDKSTFIDVLHVLKKYDLLSIIPSSIRLHIERGIAGELAETPKPGDVIFQNTFFFIMGNNTLALEAAKAKAIQKGVHVIIENYNTTGDTYTTAKAFIEKYKNYMGPLPCCVLMGGETSLRVTGQGKGGRNQHFVLSCLDEMKRSEKTGCRITVFAAGTDGTDGITDAAGAVADLQTLYPASTKKIEIAKYLRDFNAWNFFNQCDGLVITGPTQTNVMDVMMLILE